MAFFEWKESFNIGVGEIDRQHREFLDYLNELHTLTAKEKNAPVSGEVIAQLKRHAEKHFDFEERLFAVIGSAEEKAQAIQHGHFLARVVELEADLAAGNAERLKSVLDFMRDWFLEHVLVSDRRYLPYVNTVMNR